MSLLSLLSLDLFQVIIDNFFSILVIIGIYLAPIFFIFKGNINDKHKHMYMMIHLITAWTIIFWLIILLIAIKK